MRKLAFLFMITIVGFRLEAIQIPRDEQVLIKIGDAKPQEVGRDAKLLLWNVQKAIQKDHWQRDVRILAAQHDFLALQEANIDEYTQPIWQSMIEFEFIFATSFIAKSYRTGVMTGSRFNPKGQFFNRSTGREPFLATPKVTLFTYYQIESSKEQLLLANIHALNFNLNRPFKEQIDSVLETISKHRGPILLVGDFNTWNTARLLYLDFKAAELGLKHLHLSEDRRMLILDHVYYRGLRSIEGQVLRTVKSSDHYPISVRMSFF